MSFDESVIVKMLFVLFALGMFISSVSTKAVGERQKGDNHIKETPRYGLDRTLSFGNLTFTAHLVKSPRSIYTIGKTTYLTNETLVEVTPQFILIVSRPFGPSQRHRWSDGSDPSTASHETVLFHDPHRQFGVVLFRRNFVKIFSETSAFEVVGKSEPHPRNRKDRRRGDGGKDDGGGDSDRLFHFLGVQFKSVNPADVEILIDRLTTESLTTATTPTLASGDKPTPPPQHHVHTFTYLEEVKLFFYNVSRLIRLGTDYVKNAPATHNFIHFLEMYKPQFSSS